MSVVLIYTLLSIVLIQIIVIVGSPDCNSSSPGVEALVGWLLDHPDVHGNELSDADTVSDDFSDEEVLEELEEAEPTFTVVRQPLPHC